MPLRSNFSRQSVRVDTFCGAKAPTLYDAYLTIAAGAATTGAITLASSLDDILFKNPTCYDAVVSITFNESGQDCNDCATDAAPSTVTQYIHLKAGEDKGFGASTAEITAFEVKLTDVAFTASASADFTAASLTTPTTNAQVIIVEGSKDGSCCTPAMK